MKESFAIPSLNQMFLVHPYLVYIEWIWKNIYIDVQLYYEKEISELRLKIGQFSLGQWAVIINNKLLMFEINDCENWVPRLKFCYAL